MDHCERGDRYFFGWNRLDQSEVAVEEGLKEAKVAEAAIKYVLEYETLSVTTTKKRASDRYGVCDLAARRAIWSLIDKGEIELTNDRKLKRIHRCPRDNEYDF